MSSLIFRPLLHDPLGWKSNKSTYADHYKWKKYRSGSKEKKRFSRPSAAVPPTTATPVTTIQPIVLTNKTEENRARTSALRSASAKTPATEPIIEEKIRPASVREVSVSSTITSHCVALSRTLVCPVPKVSQKRNHRPIRTTTAADIG